MTNTDPARRMLVMAGKDLKALHALLDPAAVDDEIFGFHAQQVVEKSLKAWIAALGGAYGRTHDITQLLKILSNHNCNIEGFETLDELNPFGVGFRYESLDQGEPPLARRNLLLRVQALYEAVEKILSSRS